MQNSFYMENLGCAKNQVDAEVMIALLIENGWRLALTPQEATVIIVNTCAFISDARAESIDISLGFRDKYPDKKIIMAGCLTERYGNSLAAQLNELDGFVGNKNPAQILDLLAPARKHPHSIEFYPREQLLSFPGSTYIKISEGCNNHCSYCSIPLIRGHLNSREINTITAEIEYLYKKGIFEFNLIAQDLAAFGSDREDHGNIIQLLQAVLKLKQNFWIRPLYIHPDKFPPEILDLMKSDNRLLPYFDLPFQHASAGILQQMGRKGDTTRHLALIDQIRTCIPGAVIRSTFLVGFPGESETDFNELLAFQKQAKIDWLGIFTYSREEDTPAYAFTGRVSRKLALARKKQLEEKQLSISEKQLDRFIGQELAILIEEAVAQEDLFLGRSYAQAPEVDGAVVVHGSGLTPGRVIQGKIIRRNGIDLEAVLIQE